ncbi:MAG: sterol desaturase family protein [Agarilytica sp.]
MRWAVPISLAGTALVWEENSWGILNLIVLPEPVKLFVVMVLFDLAIYWQHRIFHIVPFLWRIHKVHHADSAFDVTTGFRFHPAEILVSVLFKMVLIVILGPSPESILIFEIVLSAAAMFSHANIRFPLGVDRVLRYAIVTPDMHRIHHSVNDNEMNKNFGFFLAVWDKVFGSYVQTPQEGQEKLVVGLSRYRNQNPSLFWWCLILPFRRNK